MTLTSAKGKYHLLKCLKLRKIPFIKMFETNKQNYEWKKKIPFIRMFETKQKFWWFIFLVVKILFGVFILG